MTVRRTTLHCRILASLSCCFAASVLASDSSAAKPGGPRILNINCWNEWTEGSYLEPDQRNSMKYLEVVREVFGEVTTAR
jgi:hypothetical protein